MQDAIANSIHSAGLLARASFSSAPEAAIAAWPIAAAAAAILLLGVLGIFSARSAR